MGMPMNSIPISFGLLLLLCGNTRILDVLLALRLPEMHPGHEVILRPVADSPVPCRSLWGRGGPQLGSWAGGCWPWAGRCSRLWPLLFPMPALGCSRSLPSSSGPPLGHMKPSGYSACCTDFGEPSITPGSASPRFLFLQRRPGMAPGSGMGGVSRRPQGTLGEEDPQF